MFSFVFSAPGLSNVQDAYVIAVEEQAKERLERLSALQKIQPIDMTKIAELKTEEDETEHEPTTNGLLTDLPVLREDPEYSELTNDDDIGLCLPRDVSCVSSILNGDTDTYCTSPETETTPANTPCLISPISPCVEFSDLPHASAMNNNLNTANMNGYLDSHNNLIKAHLENGPSRGKTSSKEDLIMATLASQNDAPPNPPRYEELDHNRMHNHVYEDIRDMDDHMMTTDLDSSGPHREMAVDVPDNFVGKTKQPPRYPPPQPVHPAPNSIPSTPVKQANGNNGTTVAKEEQLERLRRYQEELKKRREEEERHFQEQEFLRTSLRGSKKLQALETQRAAVVPPPSSGFVNTAFDEEEDRATPDLVKSDSAYVGDSAAAAAFPAAAAASKPKDLPSSSRVPKAPGKSLYSCDFISATCSGL